MKKLIALFLSLILAYTALSFPAGAEEGETIRAWRIADTVESAYWHGIISNAVYESAAVEKTLAVGRNESLVVPRGITVTLKKGARIDGAIYIHKGGKLRVEEGSFSVSPSGGVISDGILSFGKKAAFTVENGGEVMIGKTGRLNVSAKATLKLGDTATVACFGKTSAKNERIGTKLAAVILTEEGVTTRAKDPEAEIPTADRYAEGFSSLSTPAYVRYLFENGVCYDAIRDFQYVYLGKVRIPTITGYTFSDLDEESMGAKYTLVEIEERDGIAYWSGVGAEGETVPFQLITEEFKDPYEN
ncbi:MAG: hypothetical protein NC084_06960 [Bacteroides sp.]|nr:hypothetical protein [Eubacterium sp.]MCM1418783.1 hypothetical protein [Roseburia sp.]MCM1462440.1 hypothetical protein [Bacteroides sp.]